MADNRNDMTRILPLWIIAVSLAVFVLFLFYSAIAGWAFMLWDKQFGFVRRTESEARLSGNEIGLQSELDRFVLLVGSGTAYNFMRKLSPEICDMRNETISVCSLEGSTKTGINLLSDAYLHGRHEPAFPILAMASAQQDEDDFICTENDRFFEVQIGEDILKVTFGARSAEEFQRTFNTESPQLDDCLITIHGLTAIRIADLAQWVWKDCTEPWRTEPHYRLFVTSPGSGSATRALFEGYLQKWSKSDRTCWPKDEKAFDLSFIRAMKTDQPWIALGSQLLYEDRLPLLQKSGNALQLIVVDDHDEPIKRGIYIYGRLSGNATQHSMKPESQPRLGYDIDRRVACFLCNLFRSLEEATADAHIDYLLLEKQKRFLHLGHGPPATAWISEQAGSEGPIHIYRSE